MAKLCARGKAAAKRKAELLGPIIVDVGEGSDISSY